MGLHFMISKGEIENLDEIGIMDCGQYGFTELSILIFGQTGIFNEGEDLVAQIDIAVYNHDSSVNNGDVNMDAVKFAQSWDAYQIADIAVATIKYKAGVDFTDLYANFRDLVFQSIYKLFDVRVNFICLVMDEDDDFRKSLAQSCIIDSNKSFMLFN